MIDDGDKKHRFIVYLESYPNTDGIHTGDLDGLLSNARNVRIFAWHKNKKGEWVRCYTPAFEKSEKRQKKDYIVKLLKELKQ